MKQKIRGILAVLLSVMMVFTLVPMAAWAEESYTDISTNIYLPASISSEDADIKAVKDESDRWSFTHAAIGQSFTFYLEVCEGEIDEEAFGVTYGEEALELERDEKINDWLTHYYYTIEEVRDGAELTVAGLNNYVCWPVQAHFFDQEIFVKQGGSVEFDLQLYAHYVSVTGNPEDVKIYSSSGSLESDYDPETYSYHCTLTDVTEMIVRLTFDGIKEIENTHYAVIEKQAGIVCEAESWYGVKWTRDEEQNWILNFIVPDDGSFVFRVDHATQEQYAVKAFADGEEVPVAYVTEDNDWITYQVPNVTSNITIRFVSVDDWTVEITAPEGVEESKKVSGLTVALPEAAAENITNLIEISEEELGGAAVQVNTSVQQVAAPSEAEQTLIGTQLSGSTVGAYLDIEMTYQVGGGEEQQITETKLAITISLTIPEDMVLDNTAQYDRTYSVIRVHNGEAEVLNVTVSGNTLTFKTNKFSTYAIVYKDAPKSTGGGGFIPTTPTEPEKPVTPEVVTHFATTIGNFKDVAYFGREAREGDVVTLKVSNTDEGDRLGLDYHNIRVEYQTEGCTMIRSGIDYHGDPLYKDGMAAEFKLAKGLNKVTATVYYNDTFAGTFQLFYCYIN